MKVIVLALMVFVLAGIGFGQTRTIKQQEAVNKTAKWVRAATAESGDGVYIDISDVSKVATLALFNVKMERNGVLMYTTMMVNCISEVYLSTNVFAQSSESAPLIRLKQVDVKEPVSYEKGGAVYDMADYACRFGKVLDNN